MNMIFIKSIPSTKGNVMLFGMLIISGLVTVGISISNIVISELAQARSIDNSINSYYGAESAIEESLYTIRKLDEIPPSGDCGLEISDLDCNLERIIEREQIYIPKIEKDSFVEINLYNNDSAFGDSNIRYLVIQGNDSTGPGTETLDVSWIGWDTTGQWKENSTKRIYTHATISPEISLEGVSVDLYNTGIMGFNPVAFKVRLKALNADVENLVISVRDPYRQEVNIPTNIVVKAIGRYKGTTRALEVEQPRSAPLSGIFDYVLFSECSLVKGGSSPECPE